MKLMFIFKLRIVKEAGILIEDLVLLIFDFNNGVEIESSAVVSKSAVNSSHFEHGDFASTESERETEAGGVVVPTTDTEIFGLSEHFGEAEGSKDFDSRNVVRAG